VLLLPRNDADHAIRACRQQGQHGTRFSILAAAAAALGLFR